MGTSEAVRSRSLGNAQEYSQLSYDHSKYNLALGQRDIHAAGPAARHAAGVTDRGHSVYAMVGGGNDAETGRRGDTEKKETKADRVRRRQEWEAKEADSASTEKQHLRVPPSPRLRVSSAHRMIAAGIIAGLLPLVHAHSFVAVMAVGGVIALVQRRWRDWILFFLAASLVALPQMWWSTHNSSVNAATFFDWQFGWDRDKDNPVWFWLKNTGLFIPLILAAILWLGKKRLVSRRLLLFYLPFTLCFIVPNLVKMAPWVWDNIKVLFYWWLASAPIVALLLARLWHQRGLRRILAVVLFCLCNARRER